MSVTNAFKGILCAAFTTNVNKLSLHTADPGTTGANDSAITHATVTWSGVSNGIDTATVSLTALTGDYTHVGLWLNSTFKQGIPCEIHYSAAADITIMVTHEAGEQ